VNHPRFRNTKAVTVGNNTFMETSISTDQKSYDRWRSSMLERKAKASKSRFLLLPADQN
jgi:hypothetical protein